MDKNNRLTKSEEKKLVRLLSKVKLPASYPVFLALCKSVPVIAVDIALMKDKNHILLTHREDEFYSGWHVPGSILVYKERPLETFYRSAKKELGLRRKDLLGVKFLTFLSHNSIRENGITLIYTARSAVKPKYGKYFNINDLPDNFLEGQNKEIEILKRFTR